MFRWIRNLLKKEKERTLSPIYKYMIDDDGEFFCIFELQRKFLNSEGSQVLYYSPYLWDRNNKKFLSHNIVEIEEYPKQWKIARDDKILYEYLEARGVLLEWFMTRIKT